MVINNRPLSYTDEKDSPLTPNNLIYGKRMGQNVRERNNDPTNSSDTVESVNKTIDYFWKMWSKDYLMEIRDIRRKLNGKGHTDIKIGDVVLIHEDKLKRSQWRIGRIDELFISKDGQIRGAGLVTNTEQGTGRLTRPIDKLYPFETENPVDSDEEEIEEPEIQFVKDHINITSYP